MWAIASGTLPAGLSLNTGSGLISGTPSSAPGSSSFTVQVQDAQSNTAQASLQIIVDAATNNGAFNGPYAFSFQRLQSRQTALYGGQLHLPMAMETSPAACLTLTAAVPARSSDTRSLAATRLRRMVWEPWCSTPARFGALNFHVAISKWGNGTFILDNQDPNTRGSGAFFFQTKQISRFPPVAIMPAEALGQARRSTAMPKPAHFR